jgi:predicted DNA-binding transcriptional regulator YafY
MNRIDRLMGIVTTLQAKQFVSAEYLANKYEISIRTVYRDIKALGENGIPVSFEPHKGYFVVQGYFLPPVSFSIDEANALVLMETIASKYADNSIKQHYETALDKIKSMLRQTEKQKINFLHSQIKVYSPPNETIALKYLSEIQFAIANKQLIQMEYVNVNSEKSNREVEPIGLTYYSMDWHLIAWCWKRKAYRDFKTSRIVSLFNTRQSFRKTNHIDINEYIKSLK